LFENAREGIVYSLDLVRRGRSVVIRSCGQTREAIVGVYGGKRALGAPRRRDRALDEAAQSIVRVPRHDASRIDDPDRVVVPIVLARLEGEIRMDAPRDAVQGVELERRAISVIVHESDEPTVAIIFIFDAHSAVGIEGIREVERLSPLRSLTQ